MTAQNNLDNSPYTKDTKTMLKDFKEFAMRGNVVDMVVGIIIGAAFEAPYPGCFFGQCDYSFIKTMEGRRIER
jgi:hypothetical protein